MEADKLEQKDFKKRCKVAYVKKEVDVELTLSQKSNNSLKTHKNMSTIPT